MRGAFNRSNEFLVLKEEISPLKKNGELHKVIKTTTLERFSKSLTMF